MAWTTFARTDFAADDALRTGRGDYIVAKDVLLARRPFAVGHFVEFSTTNAAFQDAASFGILIPDYAISGWFIHCKLQIKVAAGSGGEIRLVNVTDSNDGTAQTGISNTTYAPSDDISVQVDAGEHSALSMKVQVKGDGANLMFVKNPISEGYNGTFWWAAT